MQTSCFLSTPVSRSYSGTLLRLLATLSLLLAAAPSTWAATLGNLVWNDVNNNGVKDTGETGLSGVLVELMDENLLPLDNPNVANFQAYVITTDAAGAFSFTNLPAGNYRIKIATPRGDFGNSSTNTDTADNQQDNDDNGTQTDIGGQTVSPVIVLDAAETDNTVDFGFIPSTVKNYQFVNAPVFDWWNGTTGQTWLNTDTTRTYTVPYTDGNGVAQTLVVTLNMVDPFKRNGGVIADLHAAATHPYDPSGGAAPYPGSNETDNVPGNGSIADPWDSDLSPLLSQTNGGYGLGFLTMGIKTAKSSERVAWRFSFNKPVKISNLSIGDIDGYGVNFGATNLSQYETPANSFQDRVEFVGRNGTNPVAITIASGTALTSVGGTVYSIYDTNANKDVTPTDAAGTTTMSTTGAITELDIFYADGSDDSVNERYQPNLYTWWSNTYGPTYGASDDQGIRIGGFGLVVADSGNIYGTVKADTNNDNAGDLAMSGVTLTLFTDPNGDGDPADGAIADDPNIAGTQNYLVTTAADGSYAFLNVRVGKYVVVQTQPSGYVTVTDLDSTLGTDDAANTSTSDNRIPVTLIVGEEDDGNDFVEEQPGSISGTVWADANNDNAGDTGIGSVTLTLFTDPNADGNPADGTSIATTSTATNGTYTFANIAPGTYVVVQTQPAGYLTVTDGDTTTPADDVANASTTDNRIPVTVAANEADTGNDFVEELTSTITGFVLADNDNNNTGDTGIAGVTLTLLDSAGNPVDGDPNTAGVQPITAVTSSTGAYTFSGLAPGTYGVAETQPAGYFDVGDLDAGNFNQIRPISVAAGATSSGNNFVDELPGVITGTVRADTDGNGSGDALLSGVTFTLLDGNGVAVDNPNTPAVDTYTFTTTATGVYTFSGLIPGNYIVSQTQPSGYLSIGDGDTTTPADDTPANSSQTDNRIPVTVFGGETDNGNDFTEQALATLSGRVLADADGNGSGDTPIQGVTLELLDGTGASIDSNSSLAGVQPTTVLTGSDGSYSFINLAPGSYQVRESQPSGYSTFSDGDSTTDTTGSPADGANASTTDNLLLATLAPGEVDNGNDFIEQALATISGRVLQDVNNDDAGDTGVEGVTLTLADASGNPIDGDPNTAGVQPVTALTDVNGNYQFSNVVAGSYRVLETQPVAYDTISDGDTTTPADDAANASLVDNMIPVTVLPGEVDNGNNFTEERIARISGTVKEDTNHDGLGETAMSGVTLTLFDTLGNAVDNPLLAGTQPYTVTTAADGSYTFTNVTPGSYLVRETDPSGFLSISDGDSTSAGDDAANNSLFDNEIPVSVTAGEVDDGNDFVDERPGSISGFVREDTDNNDSGDTNLSGISLLLIDATTGNPADNPNISGFQPYTVFTTSTGAYSFTGLTPGSYSVVAVLPTGYIAVSDADESTPGDDAPNEAPMDQLIPVGVGPGETDTENNFVFERTATISGIVQEDTDNNDTGDTAISGVVLTLLDANGFTVDDPNIAGTQPYTLTTGSSGIYTFVNLAPGSYIIRQTQPAGFITVTDADTTADTTGSPTDPANSSTTDNRIPVHVMGGETDNGNVFFEERTATISGTVTKDTDNNNLGDTPLEGINLTLQDSLGNAVDNPNTPAVDTYTVATDINGAYAFTNLPPGSYRVVETQPSGLTNVSDGDATTDTAGSPTDPANSSTTDDMIPANVMGGETDTGNNFVEKPIVGTVSGFVLEDTNGDSLGDTGIPGVTLALLDTLGNAVDNPFISGTQPYTVTTGVDGSYSFPGLLTGTYQVQETQPSGFFSVSDSDGGNPDLISNIILPLGGSVSDQNFVENQRGTISGSVLGDTDNNGSGDAGIPNVTLALLDSSGNAVDDPHLAGTQPYTVTTNSSGAYSFTSIPPGSYRVAETQPIGFLDVSDVDGGNLNVIGNVTPIMLAGGATVSGRDFIEEAGASISGFVLVDTNNDNVGDTPLPGIMLELCDATCATADSDPETPGIQPYSVMTQFDGSYTFTGLRPGTYSVKQIQPSGYINVTDTDSTTDTSGSPSDPVNSSTLDNLIPLTLRAGELDSGNDFIEEEPAAITGTVWVDLDDNGTPDAPLSSVTLSFFDSVGNPVDGDPNTPGIQPYTTVTSGSGTYGSLALPPGEYEIRATLPAGYLIVSDGDSTSDLAGSPADPANTNTLNLSLRAIIAGGETDSGNDFILEPAAGISGVVTEDTDHDNLGDEPLQGVTLTLYDGNGVAIDDPHLSGTQPYTVLTAADGSYSFTDLIPGTYEVRQTQPAGLTTVSDGDSTSDDPFSPADPANSSLTDNSIRLVLGAGEAETGNDFVEEVLTVIAGTLMIDTDGNGSPDAPFQGATLTLLDSSGNPVDLDPLTSGVQPWTVQTDSTGAYLFQHVLPGTYTVLATLPNGYAIGSDGDTTTPADDATNSSTTDLRIPVTVVSGETDDGNRFIVTPKGTISGFVLNDTDGNGSGDSPLQGVTLQLLTAAGSPVDSDPDTAGIQPWTTLTDVSGAYSFVNVDTGSYLVRQVQPSGYYTVSDGDTTSPGDDTPANIISDNQIPVTLTTGEIDDGNSFTEAANAVISGIVMEDTGSDNVGDTPLANVTVGLFDSSGNPIDGDPLTAGVQPLTTTTAPDGSYSFTGLPAGSYQVRVTLPSGMQVALDADTTTPADDAANSSSTDGMIPATLTPGEVDDGHSFVLFSPASISGTNLADTNNDNAGDSVINVVSLALFTDLNGDGDSDDAGEGAADNPNIAGTQPYTITTASGTYLFSGLRAGSYIVKQTQPSGFLTVTDLDSSADLVSSPVDAANADALDNAIPVTLAPGETDSGNTFVEEQPGTLSGTVLADTNNDMTGDTPISGVLLTLLDSNGQPVDSDPLTPGVQPFTALTQTDGSYSFTGVPPGTYSIAQTQPTGYLSVSDSDGGDLDIIENISVTPGVTLTGLSFVEEQSASISGTVRVTATPSNAPLSGITLTLFTDPNNDGNPADGSQVGAPFITGVDGTYSFTDLAPGTYVVVQTLPSSHLAVSDGDSTSPGDDLANASLTDSRIPVALSAGESDTGNDFLSEQKGSISGFVMNDTDNNGSGDAPLQGFSLRLFTDPNGDGNPADGTLVTTVVSQADGSYTFPDVTPGNYVVVQVQPRAYLSVSDGDTTTPGDDATNTSLTDNAIPVTITSGETDTGNSFTERLSPLYDIAGQVRLDTDYDQSFADTDPGLAGYTVELRLEENGGDSLLTTTTTDSTGNYSFPDLPLGTYSIVIIPPSPFLHASQDADGGANRSVQVVLSTGDATSVDYLETGSPQGYFYDVETGDIIPGGSIAVTPPSGGTSTIYLNGSTGEYSWLPSSTPGTYSMAITLPAGYTLDPARAPSATLDPTGLGNPYLVGEAANTGSTALVDYSAANNPWHTSFTLTAGDPLVLFNNIPLLRNKPATFAGWQTRNPLGGQNGATQDPDADGVSNFGEFAFCYNPSSGLHDPCPMEVEVMPDGSIKVLVRQLTDAPGLVYTLQALPTLSASPAGWVNVTTLSPTIVASGDGTSVATYLAVDTLPLFSPGTQGFLRVRATDTASGATSITEVYGFTKRVSPAGCVSFSNPYCDCPILQGKIDSVGGSVFQLGTAVGAGNISNVLVPGKQYFIEITSGDHAGHRFEITEGATTATTASANLASSYNTLTTLPATLAGDSFVLSAHRTIGELFPVSKFAGATNSPSTADRLLFFENGNFVVYWLFANSGNPRWVASASASLADEGGVILPPGVGIYAHPKASSLSITYTGRVRNNPFVKPLPVGSILVGSPWPLDQSPNSRGMTLAAGFVSTRSPTTSEKILLWKTDTSPTTTGYNALSFLTVSGAQRWVEESNASLTSQNAVPLFKSMQAATLKVLTAKPTYTMPTPWTP